MLGCSSEVPPPGGPRVATPIAVSATAAALTAPVKPTVVELRVTNEAGGILQPTVKDEAFTKCLAVAEPGERGYALFLVHLRDAVPDPWALTESEGLAQPTLDCIRAELKQADERAITARRTLWYFSVGP